jgi:hypothetical protein
LKNPYVSLTNANENKFNLLRGIFVGDDSLGMGRPKFLSDQLFNKCLLQSVYDDRANEEMRAINTSNHTNSDGKSNLRKMNALIHSLNQYFNLSRTSETIPVPGAAGALPAGLGIGNGTAAVAAASTIYLQYIDPNQGPLTITGPNITTLITMSNADILTELRLLIGTAANFAANIRTLHRLVVTLSFAKDLSEAGTAGGVGQWGTNAGVVDPAIYTELVALSNGLDNLVAHRALNDDGSVRGMTSLSDVQINRLRDILKPNGELDNNFILQNALRVVCLLNGGGGRVIKANRRYYADWSVGNFPARNALIVAEADANKKTGFTNNVAVGADYGLLNSALNNIIQINKNIKYVEQYVKAADTYAQRITGAVCTNAVDNARNGYANVIGNINTFMNNYGLTHGMAVNTIPARFLDNKNVNKNDNYLANRTSETGLLSYVKEGEVVYHRFTAAQMAKFDDAYAYRFNSYLVRDLFFITNINRLLRQVFENELTGSREVVKHGYELANAGLTEYGQYPMKPNEISTSAQGNGLKRLVRDADSAEFYSS